jgi:hypothetical protein
VSKVTRFKDVIKRIDRIEPDPPHISGRYILILVCGSIALTDKEYTELGSPEEDTILEIRIKNTEINQ